VAEDIAATLRKSRLEVDLMHVRKVRALEAYGFIMLGAPIYFDRWHKDAFNFLVKNQEALTPHSIESPGMVIFALGPTHNDEKEWQYSRRP
jgi:menaquinone-dependent protoporphyrinogen IX oxidase